MGEAKKIDPMTIAGMVLGGLGLAVGVYVAFIVAPEVAYLDGLDTKSDAQRAMWYDLLDKQINFGTAAMGLGGLGFVLAIRPALKTKSVVAIAAVADSLIAFFLGAAYGTHMFS